MSDSPCGFSKDQFLAILHEYGPVLSAHEVAALGKVSVKQVLCAHHHADWDIQQVAGENGWLYQKRQTVAKSVRAADWSPKVYNDAGLTKRSPKVVTK